MRNEKASNIARAIERMPKVELHVHFGGSIRPETLEKLAEKNGIDLRQTSAKSTRYGHLIEFLDSYRIRTKCLQSAEDVEFACVDVLKHLKAQNVRYAEITISPVPYRLNGLSMDEIAAGIEAAAKRVCKYGEFDVRFILDIGRQFGIDHAWQTVHEAVQYQAAGVVALGLGGDEIHYAPEMFAEQFEFARKHGLHRVAHAGEVGGSDSIWGALRSLHAERIGHGIGARGDDVLIEYLHAHRIPLELCPTSNVRTNAVRSLAEHPLPEFLRRGLMVTLNTDDPPMFGATLNGEYILCHEEFGLDWGELKTLCLNGVRASFLPDLYKQELLESFEKELAEIEADEGIV